MCGIAGIIAPLGTEAIAQRLRVLADSCARRGPDDEGLWARDGIGLAHRRLAIIDLSPRGHQPMNTEDEGVVLTHNGEVYNFKDLRRELEQAGHRFQSDTDTEVILAGYLEWGIERLLDRADGMFAFALLDRRSGTLWLARDRFGEKPLYYHAGGCTFVFCSEIAGVRRVLDQVNLDLESLDHYLAELAVPQPRTIWREIRQLRPASYLRIRLGTGELDETCYWRPRFDQGATSNEEEALDCLDGLLATAVRRRTISDRPLGALLSGGIDSGLVVTQLARVAPDRARTFTVGFGADDETNAARAVALRCQTRHHELQVEPGLIDDIDAALASFGEPFADSSCIPTFLIAREIRRHVTVVLGGDGGDELFGGYSVYERGLRAERLAKQLPRRPIRKAVRYLHSAASRVSMVENWGEADDYLDADGAGRLSRGMGFDERGRQALYSSDCRAAAVGYAAAYLNQVWGESTQQRPIDTLFEASLRTRLLNDYLVKVDRATMAHALEARSPFLDRALAEFAFSLAPELKIRQGTSKYLTRRLLARYQGGSVLTAPKRGFSVPLATWLRGGLRSFMLDHLESPTFRNRGLFCSAYVRRLINEHDQGRMDHSHRLWALLCLEQWMRRGARATDVAAAST